MMFKNIKKSLIAMVVLQVSLGLLHMLFIDLGHPLNKTIQTLPILLQVLIISLYALIVYAMAGYLVMVAINRKSSKMIGIGRVLIMMASIFLIVFLGIFSFYMLNGRQSLWLIYSVVNPLFGTAMYNRVPETLMGLLWSVSAVIPGIGILLGMNFGVRKGEL